MAETDTWAAFKKLAMALDPVRIENLLGKGTPDVNCVGCWVELKWLSAWPKRASTPVRLDHYTDEQRLWLKRRGEAGEPTWLCLQVGQEWFLFRGKYSAQDVGKLTYSELVKTADYYWPKKPTPEQFVYALTN